MPSRSWGEDSEVPARVQAELIRKLGQYDRNFLERARKKVVIAIVARPSDVDSSRATSQMEAAFKELGPIAGLTHEEMVVPWNGARNLADLCAQRGIAIIYLTPGLAGEIGALARELEGKSVWTVAGMSAYVGKGAVLGFELVSGRPKLVINLTQAKKQNVLFQASVLSLMRIVQ